jgi:hypothetical protein
VRVGARRPTRGEALRRRRLPPWRQLAWP